MNTATMVIQPTYAQTACPLNNLSRQFDLLTIEVEITNCNYPSLIADLEAGKSSVSGETRGYYEFLLGMAYFSLGDNFNARIALGRAQVEYDNAKNHLMRAAVRYHFGKVRAAENRLDEAFTFYGQAETIARQHNITLILGRVLLEYGKRQEAEGKLAEIFKTMEDALDNLLLHPRDTQDEQREALLALSRAYDAFKFNERGALYRQMSNAVNLVDVRHTLRSFDLGQCQVSDVTSQTDFISFERSLPACNDLLAEWSIALENLRTVATTPSDRARYGVLRGLLLEARGGQDNLFEAKNRFEQALNQFREANDTEGAALASFYLAQNYYARNQKDLAQQFYGSVANNTSISAHTRGRAQFNIALLQYERGEIQTAALSLQTARTTLLTVGDRTLPDQFEILLLLTQIYGELRDSTKARETNQLLNAVEQRLYGNGESDFSASNLCDTPDALFALPLSEIDRTLGRCSPQNRAALALGSRIVRLNSRRAIERGRAQMFIGLAHYYARDWLEASPKLGNSLPDLNAANDRLAIGLVNYYLSDVYLQGYPTERPQSENYLQSALDIFTELNDKYYIGLAQLEQGRRRYEIAGRNKIMAELNTAAAIIEAAYQNFRIAPVATCDQQRKALDYLIDLYSSRNLGNEVRRQDFVDQRGRVTCTVVATPQPTPTNEPSETTTPVPEAPLCSTDIVLVLEDYLEIDERLSQCVHTLEVLLQAAQTREAQATDTRDNEAIAQARMRLGLVNYYQGRAGQQGRYGEAVMRFEQAFTRFRDLGDTINHGLAMYYIVRAQIAQISDADWARVRREPSYRPAPLNPATTYINEVRRISARAGDTLTLARLETLVADIEYLSARLGPALNGYNKALDLFRQSQTTAEGVEVRLRVAQIRSELSEFEVVRLLLEEVLNLPGDEVLPDQQARAILLLAQQNKYFGRYEIAAQLAEDALTVALDPVIRVLVQAEQGDIAREAGDLGRASQIVQLYETALSSLNRCQDADQLRLYTGYYYVSLGNASQAKAIFNDITGTECIGRTALDIARAHSGLAAAELTRRSGDAQTLEAINVANRDFDRINYQPGYVSARIQLARYYRIRREWAEVERWLGAAERRANDLGDLRGLVDAMVLRVEGSIDRGLYTVALSQLAQATTLYSQMGHALGTNNTLETRLRIYTDQADFIRAQQVLDEARQINANLSFNSRLNYYQGRLFELQGNNELALSAYDNASIGFARLGEALNKIEVDLRIAGIRQRRGELDEADTIVTQVLDVATNQDNPFYIGQVRAFEADLKVARWAQTENRELNDPLLLQAVTSFRAALVAYENAVNLTGQADVYTRLGELALVQQENTGTFNPDIGGPTVNLGRALDLYRRIGNSIGQARVHSNQGRYFGLVRNYNEAHNNFNQALRILGESDPYLRANVLTRQGLIYEYQHYAQQQTGVNPTDFLRRARANYERATELLGFAYGEIGSNSAQRSFGTQAETIIPYSRLVRILATYNFGLEETERSELVLRYTEQSRARSYLTALQDTNINISERLADQDPALARWFTLRNEIITLTRELNNLRAVAGDQVETATLQTEINVRILELQQVEGQIRQDALRQLISINVAELTTLQAALPTNTALVTYYIVEGLRTPTFTETARIIVTVVGRNDVQTIAVRVEDFRRDLDDNIERLYIQKGQVRGGQINLVQNLHALLIAPIRQVISPYEALVLVPHSQLNYLAFETLTADDGQMLLESHIVTYAPSATVYTLMRNSPSPTVTTSGETLVLAYQGTAQELDKLEWLESEVSAIRAAAPRVVAYEGSAATIANLLSSVREADVLHFASHGVFDPKRPLESYLALAPDQTQTDGKLNVADIYRLSLTERRPLVLLSACQLAYSAISNGDELEGMIRAFLISGARGVVASLWYADDQITAELMEYFYQNRAQGMTNAQALTMAKRSMAAANHPPALWAGFILISAD